jgi:hypothetical protein
VETQEDWKRGLTLCDEVQFAQTHTNATTTADTATLVGTQAWRWE